MVNPILSSPLPLINSQESLETCQQLECFYSHASQLIGQTGRDAMEELTILYSQVNSKYSIYEREITQLLDYYKSLDRKFTAQSLEEVKILSEYANFVCHKRLKKLKKLKNDILTVC